MLETIDMNAGMAAGQLPELATSTRSSDVSSEDTDSDGAAHAAPTSVVHLGAPPPPPPTSIPSPGNVSIHLAEVRPEDVRFDSNGEMWAAACEPPEDTPSTLMIDTDTSIEVGVTMGSPLAPAAYMMGLGLLSPPPALMHAPISPIQTTNLLMIEDKKEEEDQN